MTPRDGHYAVGDKFRLYGETLDVLPSALNVMI
jgi:hypothetical protein